MALRQDRDAFSVDAGLKGMYETCLSYGLWSKREHVRLDHNMLPNNLFRCWVDYCIEPRYKARRGIAAEQQASQAVQVMRSSRLCSRDPGYGDRLRPKRGLAHISQVVTSVPVRDIDRHVGVARAPARPSWMHSCC